MTGLHESTLGWSVYNALARCGRLSRPQALVVLTKHWEPEVESSEIDDGVAYLLKRGFVTEADGILAPVRTVNGAAATLIRNPLEQSELVYSRKQVKVKDGARLDA